MKMNFSKYIAPLGCILLPVIIGSFSGLASIGSLNDWYVHLNKPSFNPPGYLFGPVWTILYLLMGVSLFLVWKSQKGQIRTRALAVFGLQMLLNFAWSFIFFHFRQIGLALADVILLWLLIALMILRFYGINKTAALIQIPYLLWVSFASVLNAAIWMLNR